MDSDHRYSGTVICPELWICAPSRALTVSPGSAEFDSLRLNTAKSALQELGWTVKEASNVRRIEKSFAGNDRERARGFEEAMCAPQADLVMGLRGGSGAARILDLVNWEKVARSQAVFVGLSDLTAINLALYAKCGKSSWQGPVAASFATANVQRTAYFSRAMSRPFFEERFAVCGFDVRMQGVIWGGNLSVLTSLIGTPYFPHIEGGILYLEDINEPAWRVSRMISQLKLSGVLDRQQALIAGDFTGADKLAGTGSGRYTLTDALAESGLPVITGVPFGHIAGTVCLPFGVQAQVTLKGGFLTLRADNCPVPTEFPGAQQANTPLWWM